MLKNRRLHSTLKTKAYISLGANLGFDILNKLYKVLEEISFIHGVKICKISNFYQTAPLKTRGPDFINCVAMLETYVPPLDLLEIFHRIEKYYGRERSWKNAPRLLDLDLLSYGNVEMETKELILPHPRIQERAFILKPLLDISPELELPKIGKIKMILRWNLDQNVKILQKFDQ
ncbi:MAG: 2-amino-4-hydroxy-6-hydroxymethyldihydropteridine diphosphokinase [Bordetella sp.]|nr:MAG: 2-amino-4-hydroxy-6-hydroxymethyldihydropteridine diphosphokinase [Bordetella sp.]